MFLLFIFAFIAGIVTILSPCILPVLPIILSSSAYTSGKRRPLGVVTGFIASFTFFTLFLSAIVRITNIPPDSLRFFSIVILFFFGLSLLSTKVQTWIELVFSKLTRFAPQTQSRHGFWGGLVIGFSLGLLWTPCVGPILASVISLAISGTVTLQAFAITLAYALGTAIPLFVIMLAGSTALQKIPWLLKNAAKIQKAFGVIMIATAIGIFFNVDRSFQTFILTTFPQYGTGLTKIEDNAVVKQNLQSISNKPIDQTQIGAPMTNIQQKGPLAPEIIPGGEWFNSKPLKLSELRGKVVVLDFWTYSCINCQRTLPYLKSWWQKYKDKGLVIIGVHAPEFEFEKNPTNVFQALKDFGITYPVVQDNNFDTWRAYNNQYWPAKYFIDKDGYIRYTHFGEGGYDESEQVIQELLKEAGAKNVSQKIDNPQYQIYAQTPETYLGYGRLDRFASNEQVVPNQSATYTLTGQIPDDDVAYQGTWTVTQQYANPQKGANLYLNFSAKNAYLVMNPKTGTAKVNVYLDDKLQKTITIDADKLYELINLSTPGRHVLRLEFLDNNTEVYAFTFG